MEDVTFNLKNRQKLKKWISTIGIRENRVIGNVNFIFCTNDNILDINVKYLNHHYFTDIITFNYNLKNIIHGDIYLSVDKICENSALYEVEFLDELYRVMIHGILHLIGYNDTSVKLQKQMSAKEDEALKILKDEFLLK